MAAGISLSVTLSKEIMHNLLVIMSDKTLVVVEIRTDITWRTGQLPSTKIFILVQVSSGAFSESSYLVGQCQKSMEY
jgi:hypothetical protein